MGIVFFYAVLGGMKGITYTQVAQYCVFIFAFTVPAIHFHDQLLAMQFLKSDLDSKADGMYLLEKLIF